MQQPSVIALMVLRDPIIYKKLLILIARFKLVYTFRKINTAPML